MASGRKQFIQRDDGGFRGDLNQGPGKGPVNVKGQARAFAKGTSDVRTQAMPSGSKKTDPGARMGKTATPGSTNRLR